MINYFPDTAMFPIVIQHSCYYRKVHKVVTLVMNLVIILPVLHCQFGLASSCGGPGVALVTPICARLSVHPGFPSAFPGVVS